jgi:hypothetical protein
MMHRRGFPPGKCNRIFIEISNVYSNYKKKAAKMYHPEYYKSTMHSVNCFPNTIQTLLACLSLVELLMDSKIIMKLS